MTREYDVCRGIRSNIPCLAGVCRQFIKHRQFQTKSVMLFRPYLMKCSQFVGEAYEKERVHV